MTIEEKIEDAKSLIYENRVDEAEAMLRKIILFDKPVQARIELARILAATSRYDEYLKQIEEVLKVEPNHADALSMKGLYFTLRQDHLNSIEYYKKALIANSKHGLAYRYLGVALREIGQLSESERVLKEGVKVEPKNLYMHLELAQSLSDQQKIVDAINQLRESIKIYPSFIPPYLAMAKLYMREKQPDSAVKILRECLEVDPEAAEATALLKECYVEQGDYDAAIQLLLLRCENSSEYGDFIELAKLYALANNFEAAEATFLTAIEFAPYAWQTHYAFAEFYDKAQILDRACQRFRLAVQFNNRSYQPHNGYGLYLLENGSIDQAIQQLTIASSLAQRADPAPTYNLARALIKAQRFAQAKLLIENFIQNAPNGGLWDTMRAMLTTIKTN
jgi:tetratricopeptide (TPR) repeat protein